jgi:hypothetical protein
MLAECSRSGHYLLLEPKARVVRPSAVATNASGASSLNVGRRTLPKGGDAINGIGEKFAANPVTATGTLVVPIAITPGRSGFGPQLILTPPPPPPAATDAPAPPAPPTPKQPGPGAQLQKGPGTTRYGIKRNNPADWHEFRNLRDDIGLGDVLSKENRLLINQGRTPLGRRRLGKTLPGRQRLDGPADNAAPVGGSPITVQLSKPRHQDAHMPGGFKRNPGGPGTSG